MLKVATALPNEPYREYKDVERVYSGSTEIDKILDKNGNVLFAVNKEVEGTPPLAYKGKEETNLKNYRIYGQTVDGESVGDRTGNLFDYETMSGISGKRLDSNGNEIADRQWAISGFIPCTGNAFTISKLGGGTPAICLYDKNQNFITGKAYNTDSAVNKKSITITAEETAKFVRFSYCAIKTYPGAYDDLTKIMLNIGAKALPYEPYGYKVPVTVEGKNLCNNIWEQKLVNADSGNAGPNKNAVCCDFIPVKPNVTYSCSRTIGNEYNNLRCYGINKNYLGTGADLANKGNPLKQRELFGTFMITDARVSYIRFNDLSNSLDTKYMLVEGVYTAETMPPYEPYYEPVTTNLYLPEPIKMVGDEAEYIDYAEQKQHRVRKNLLPNTATSMTINGITFTVNEDGSITCNGTATNTAEIRLVISFSLPAGNYRLTGTPSSGSTSSYYLRAWYNSGTTTVWIMDDGSGYNFTLTDTAAMNSSIVIRSNQVLNHITFYPMLRKADIEDDTYEPYIKNVDLDVTLPALPVLSGTNTLTVGTEVQPSNVYLKGRIKEIA